MKKIYNPIDLTETTNLNEVPESCLVLFAISQEEVERRNIRRIVKWLHEDLEGEPAVLRKLYGKVIFSFSYDHVREDLHEIPEILEYLKELNSHWRGWLFFSVPDFQALVEIVNSCLSDSAKPSRTGGSKYLITFLRAQLIELLIDWINAALEIGVKAELPKEELCGRMFFWFCAFLKPEKSENILPAIEAMYDAVFEENKL